MRFEEAYEGGRVRRLTQEEAARLLGVHERTFRRYIDRYEEAELERLMDKRLEQISHRRAPDVKVRVHRYPDGRLALFHGPRRRADYDAKGRLLPSP